jgi:transposase InsO family protein
MSRTASPSSGKNYGLRRVCAVWAVARSTVYWQKAHEKSGTRRGPQGPHTDAELLRGICEHLEQSPFHGEGYRKLHAVLRMRDLRTSPVRVMRIMRENGLQAVKSAGHAHGPKAHDGNIKTVRINEMWGTDMTTTLTTREGAAGIFFAIDHCSLEVVGLHAAKRGTRFEALEPLRQGVARNFSIYGEAAAKGLTLRHDHGSQFMSDTFQDELKFLGIRSSPAFVREPQGNGIAERFVRTLKENLLWIKAFDTVEELRLALLEFQKIYNTQWLVARHGYKTPAQVKARQLDSLPTAA